MYGSIISYTIILNPTQYTQNYINIFKVDFKEILMLNGKNYSRHRIKNKNSWPTRYLWHNLRDYQDLVSKLKKNYTN